jgi:hypothetical protein
MSPFTGEYGGPLRPIENRLRRWGWLILSILCIGAGFCFGYTACALDWIHR